MAPLYDQVCTMAWPELSSALSMKIGSASSLTEVSPEHFKQLCGMAKLGWPMVRERSGELCRKTLETIHDREALPTLRNPTVDNIVAQRSDRMLGLLEKFSG
jgi:serine/threonine-protein kinase HipA